MAKQYILRGNQAQPSAARGLLSGRRAASLLLAGACSLCWSQTPTPAAAPSAVRHQTIVPLVSDACPVVHPGEWVSFDINPGFDHPSAVLGLRGYRLTFSAVSDDGVNLRQRNVLEFGLRGQSVRAAPTVNGFYHVEAQLAGRSRSGTYRLTWAQALPRLDSSYTGPETTTSVSPVRERYCITVAPLPPAPAQP